MSSYTDAMYKRAERVRSRIIDAHLETRAFFEPHSKLAERVRAIRASPDYTKLSAYYKGYIEATIRCEGDRMYDYLEWRHFLDGKYLLPEEMPKDGYSRIDPNQSRHVYKHNPGRFY